MRTGVLQERDAMAHVASLTALYPSHVDADAAPPVPGRVRQRDLPMIERVIRREVARQVLEETLPDLVAELVEAASDELTAAPLTDLEAQSDAELRVIEAVEHAKAVLDAAGLQALARLRSCVESTELARPAELGGKTPAGWLDADRLTMLEVTTATGLGPQEVHDRLDLATDRTRSAADLRARLRAGTISLHRARLLHDQTRHLADTAGDTTALGLIEAVLRPKDGAPPSPTLFRQRLTRACLAADRDAALKRRRARRRRGAFARIDPHGLGVLTVTNDADKILAAMERADTVARAARHAGDPRTLDVLRADAITDLLRLGTVRAATASAATEPDGACSAGSASAASNSAAYTGNAADIADGATDEQNTWTAVLGRRPAATISLIVPLPVALGALGAVDTPCNVPGYGWVDAEHARALMTGPEARWRLIGVDPATGTAQMVSTTTYRPTPAICALVEAVDGTCRGPGCTIPAARCDLDIPWPHGPTDATNLTSKHREHHNTRTHGHWTATRDEHARVHWRTTAGRRYTTHPKDWLQDLRPAPPPTPRRHDDSPPPF